MPSILNRLRRQDDSVMPEIDKLSHAERKAIRTHLEKESIPLPQNLYFDYKTQTWID